MSSVSTYRSPDGQQVDEQGTSLLTHERVQIVRGARSGLTLIVAVHSTALGQAVGGCRLWHYGDWRDAVKDALRLSEAMSLKCSLAGLPHGGGKAVIALPEGRVLSPHERRDVFLDLGDLVESFGGRYGTAEDVGTTAGSPIPETRPCGS